MRVRVGDHVLAAIGPAATEDASQHVTLAVRQESVRLGAATTDGPGNRLDGRVVEATFLGNIVDYQVDLGGLLLRVQADRHVVQEIGGWAQAQHPGRGMRRNGNSAGGSSREREIVLGGQVLAGLVNAW